MKNPWIRPLQLCIGAAVLGMAGLATAQPAPPADGAPPPPPAAEKAKPHHHKKHADKGPAQRGYDRRDPAQHEAAAVKEQARRGGIQSGDHFQRNAVARCDVFKNEADHRSCVDRVKDGQVSGSVEGGGVLREYTEQVPVKP
ncbi:Uncharacterised protein [Delftia tsuruhatensis]|uniref:hypothetical protein n=1 Tax=Delftia tsuruhatensis TaxID=180282 RepID=UPI001E80530E|nr:hypothetical protein [Delftia tsuruhatensis]CAB5693487.1 Uncharacterised protein [Delftia tsuruhatensis]CAC9687444.1 Uncharacterised protein [Delftia tsuruhatensis]